MSHFEQFKSYHSKIYSKVEAASLTPYCHYELEIQH